MIKEIIEYKGRKVELTWIEDFDISKLKNIVQVYGVLFNDKGEILIVSSTEGKEWGLPGGVTDNKDGTFTFPDNGIAERRTTDSGGVEYVFIKVPKESPAAPPATGTPTGAYNPLGSRDIAKAQQASVVETKLNAAIGDHKQLEKAFSRMSTTDKDRATKARELDVSKKNVEKLQKQYDKLKGSSAGTAAATAAAPSVIPGIGEFKTPDGHLLAGLFYAGATYAALEFATDMFGIKDAQKEAVKYGVSSGVMVHQ